MHCLSALYIWCIHVFTISGPPIKDIEMAPRPSVSVALPSPVGAPPSIGVRPISTQLGVPELGEKQRLYMNLNFKESEIV